MKLAAALVVFAGGITVAVHHHTDAPAMTTAVAPAGKHRADNRVSRSMRRLPSLLHHPRHRAPSLVRTVPSQRGGARQLLTITAYCWTGARNAGGHWPTIGTAAANSFPLGTRLHVAGYGDITVEDRSAPGATDVDLYLGDGSACDRAAALWGVRRLPVTVIPR